MPYLQGLYQLRNPQKYKGDPTCITYRSSWELKVFQKLDNSPSVLEWASESITIPYNDKASGRLRRYFPDIWVKIKSIDGKIKTMIVEIKPKREAQPPERGTKTEKRFLRECLTYAKNISKWEAAGRYCKQRGWEFRLLTEEELGTF
jgi:hypothetical protein